MMIQIFDLHLRLLNNEYKQLVNGDKKSVTA